MDHDNQVLTVAQMQAAEDCLRAAGMTSAELMQEAGRGAADWVWRVAAGRAVTVLCGPGNNGGDGFVIAHELHNRGLAVCVIEPEPSRSRTARQMREALPHRVFIEPADHRGEILVDSLFGVGLKPPLSSNHRDLLNVLASQHSYRIAIDLPSGLHGDGEPDAVGPLPIFDLTLAIGAWKHVHWTMPNIMHMGRRERVPIGIGKVARSASVLRKPAFEPPTMDAHKYTRGFCVIVHGSMHGAALLAASAAAQAGAGYVKLHGDLAGSVVPHDLAVASDAMADDRVDALCIGPGLGRGPVAMALLGEALERQVPTVLDADALHLLEPKDACKNKQLVATPHEGELAGLCDRFDIAGGSKRQRVRSLANRSGMVVLAKGADTMIAAPDGNLVFAGKASSWLSVAGSGDVLAGIVASRLATGSGPMAAACEAVWLHGEAARTAGGPFTPSQLAHHVGPAVRACL